MYNGIGLPTPRGSGTNGYVQRNLAHVRKVHRSRPNPATKPEKPEAEVSRKLNPAIALHKKKREIEAKCLMLRTELEEEGWKHEKIDREVDKYRKRKLDELMREEDYDHEDKLKQRFGISKDYVPGSSVTQMKRQKTEPKDEVKVEPKKEPKIEIKKEEKR